MVLKVEPTGSADSYMKEGVKDDSELSDLGKRWTERVFTEMQKTVRKTHFYKRNDQEFRFRHRKSEMPVRHEDRR